MCPLSFVLGASLITLASAQVPREEGGLERGFRCSAARYAREGQGNYLGWGLQCHPISSRWGGRLSLRSPLARLAGLTSFPSPRPDLEIPNINWDLLPGCYEWERAFHAELLDSDLQLVDLWRRLHPAGKAPKGREYSRVFLTG